MVMLIQECRMCHEEHSVSMPEKHIERVRNGEHIQNVAPYLSADERELLISGTCGKCFDSLFSGGELND